MGLIGNIKHQGSSWFSFSKYEKHYLSVSLDHSLKFLLEVENLLVIVVIIE